NPSANRSPTSRACRLLGSVKLWLCERKRYHPQAHAKRRFFLLLALPRTNISIGAGSVQASHSASVIPTAHCEKNVTCAQRPRPKGEIEPVYLTSLLSTNPSGFRGRTPRLCYSPPSGQPFIIPKKAFPQGVPHARPDRLPGHHL